MHDLARQATSFLFVPATRPERLGKALDSGADMVIADWEDAVAPAEKDGARQALAQAVGALEGPARARLLVRINAEGTPGHADDLRALAQLVEQGVAGAMVSKAERAQTLHAVAQATGARAAVLPLVESVAGLDAADALAAAPQVVRLAFGHLDFQVDAGMACGQGVTVDTRNPERLAQDAARARRMGFGGKLCIHPAQVQPLHTVFDPDEAAVAHAQRLRQALAEAGGGVCVLDGRMVDAPVLKQAEQVLLRHAWAQRRAAAH
jgi:citrate lyase subunit beta/citryl-CoA lyase